MAPGHHTWRAWALVVKCCRDKTSCSRVEKNVARLLRVGCAETVRKWVRQVQVDGGARVGTTTEESAELERLRRENPELRRANAILQTASAFFAAELCATRRQVYREVVRDRLCWAVAAA
ncbi:transposase [Mycobacterium sp. URHB0021]